MSYYDDHNFPSAIASSLDFEDDLGNRTPRTNMKGELTGSLTRNLTNDSWLGSVIYYDEQYRPIVAVTENHLGGIDRTTTRYTSSVLDEVEETFTTHTTTAGSHIVRQTYDYDHQGRLLAVTHQLDNQRPAVKLARYTYNELGQLVQQEINADAPDEQVSQTVDYRYHVRGWLKGINDVNEADDYFSQELVYERGGNTDVVQFNGNVTDQYWRNWGQDEQSYQYKYDEADRLINAVHSGPYSTKSIKYDGNGNLTDLQRFTQGAAAAKKMDFLQYSYQGNRLTKVKERSGGDLTLGFVDGANSNEEYGHDAADNKLWQQVVDVAGNEVVTTDYLSIYVSTNWECTAVYSFRYSVSTPGPVSVFFLSSQKLKPGPVAPLPHPWFSLPTIPRRCV